MGRVSEGYRGDDRRLKKKKKKDQRRNAHYPALYSYCKYTNEPSFRTAESIGMRFACEYPDKVNGKTHVSVIAREEWLNGLTENMVSWAEDKLGSKE